MASHHEPPTPVAPSGETLVRNGSTRYPRPMDSGASAFDQLLDRRVVLATGRLDSALADRVTAQLLMLDNESDAPIEMLVDCPDAELDPAFTLLDVCEALAADLRIVVTGRLTGAGMVLLTTRHRRVARPHATLQVAEPHVATSTQSADAAARLVEEHRRRIGILIERISERTTRPAPLVADEMSRGVYLTSEEAVTYGLLDDIARRAPSS
jgi:ATP-dependent Clp protease, protease subunit